MPDWVLVVIVIGHIAGTGAQPMSSSTLPMASQQACEAAGLDLRQHLAGAPFAGGNLADILTRCEPTATRP